MNILARALLVFALLLPGLACAEPTAESRAEAARLLEVLDMRAAMDKMVALSLDTQIEAKPELAPYRGVMLKFFQKYMSYDALKPQLVEIYADSFTAGELREIQVWYASPTGKKALLLMPKMLQAGTELGHKQLDGHMDEFVKMMQDEKARLDAQKAAAEAPAAPATSK